MNKTIEIAFDKFSSHAGVLRQLVDGLVDARFASREEIEEEFVSLLQTKTYRKTVG